jgi:hypothetical protein
LIHRAKSIRLPFGAGRFLWTRDRGEAEIFADQFFATNVTAHHYDGDGKLRHVYDIGSGLTTNVFSQALIYDPFLAAPSGAAINALKSCIFHATGTGATAAAATDIALQTSAGPTPVTGTQTPVFAANSQILQNVATLNYSSTLAITEWGLFNSATLSATTGTPFTATTAASATATATPYTASSSTVQGQQQMIVVPGTTTVYGFIKSNTTSVLTVPAWYKVADGTLGSTPGSTEAFTIKPLMLDHKVFAAINVVSGDSIQFTHSLTANSGG